MTLTQLRRGAGHLFIRTGIAAFAVGVCAVFAVMFLEAHTHQVWGGPVVFHPRWEPWYGLVKHIVYFSIHGGFLLTFLGGLLLRGIPPSVRRGWKFCSRKFTRVIQYIAGISPTSRSHLRLAICSFKVAMVCSIVIVVTVNLFTLSERQENILVFATVAIGGVLYSVRVYRVLRRMRQ